jgi:hypothetical protein
MQMLYDSEAFVVVHVNATQADNDNRHNAGKPERHGFEIVDKRSNMTVYLDGLWAAAFQAQIERWQAKTPDQEEVETILDSYSLLAQYPLVVH